MDETAPTTHSLAFDDKVLSYFTVGAGPAVVIVHGVGGHKGDWAGVAIALAASHRVFAIDMLGFGASSKTGDDLSTPVQAAAIAALLDAQGIAQADLVGNSVGAWVCATFAATFPSRVNRLVISDAAGFKAMFEGPPPVNFDPDNADDMQQLIDITINSDVARTPGLAQKAFNAYVASGEKAIAAIWGKSLLISPRLEELLPKISAPTMVLWGEDDKLFPSALASVFARLLPCSTARLIPRAGHFLQIDNPTETTGAIVAFLS